MEYKTMGLNAIQFGWGGPWQRGKFDLGAVVGTPAAVDAMQGVGVPARTLLTRHILGDWGDCATEDAEQNNEALVSSERLMSVYKYWDGAEEIVLWVVTEGDRSVTTILTPDDY